MDTPTTVWKRRALWAATVTFSLGLFILVAVVREATYFAIQEVLLVVPYVIHLGLSLVLCAKASRSAQSVFWGVVTSGILLVASSALVYGEAFVWPGSSTAALALLVLPWYQVPLAIGGFAVGWGARKHFGSASS